MTVTALNLVNVKVYGELEFWFAIIKVVALLGMIALGLVLVVFDLGGPATGISNLWIHGGFFPNGMHGLLFSLVVVMFSFGGTELIGITAGEADDPKKSIPQAIKQVMWRILLFYVGSLTIMMMIFPWNKVGMEGSPFVTIFSKLGIGSAAHILNFVVLSAAVSVYNSGIYSNSRMLLGLAEQGNAPKIFMKLSANKVPYIAILFSSFITLAVVVINYLIPKGAFMQVMAVATTAAVLTWILIVLVHMKFRREKERNRERLQFKSPFFPYINYLCVAFLVLIVALMSQMPEMATAVYVLPIWLGLLYLGFRCKRKDEHAENMLMQPASTTR